jgi:hypothetical protein
MAGPLKTLFLALQASAYLQGVSLAFGEESRRAQEYSLPLVCMVPRGGPYSDPEFTRQVINGQIVDIDPTTERVWQVNTTIDLYLWATSNEPGALPIDEADAAETLRVLVCSALQDQRAMTDVNGNVALGLNFTVERDRWETMEDGWNRFGRALVISVQIPEPVLMPPPPEATVTSTNFTLQPLNRVPG